METPSENERQESLRFIPPRVIEMKKKAAKHPNGFPFSYHQHFFNQRKGSNNTEMIWSENKEANH